MVGLICPARYTVGHFGHDRSLNAHLAQLAEVIVQLVKSCLCMSVCLWTRVSQVITAERRDLSSCIENPTLPQTFSPHTTVFRSQVSAFVVNRLDYCNSLLVDLPPNLLQRLQSVQISAARLIYRLRRSEHITDTLLSLHWLRVQERVDCRVQSCRATYKALNGLAPPYLLSAFTHVADVPSRRRLRSASTDQLLVPSYRRLTTGRRTFPIAGARIWNGLPSDVTSARSLAVFGRRLKTELFRRC